MGGLVRAAVLALVLVAGSAATAATYDLTPEGNARFLADFAALKGVTKLPSGVMYRVVEAGSDGTSPISRWDMVTVEYKGWLVNGKIFDKSPPQETRTFTAANLIPGWREALMKMKTGDTWQLVIPADQAYGADGVGDVVPPDQTLVFTVRLVKVEYAP